MITIVHCEQKPFDIYIGRESHGRKRSKWANPFIIGRDGTRKEVIAKFRQWMKNNPLLADLHELDNKVLGCWCGKKSCHGQVLIELREQQKRKSLFPI
jgi:hypothetical protein